MNYFKFDFCITCDPVENGFLAVLSLNDYVREESIDMTDNFLQVLISNFLLEAFIPQLN